MMFLCVLLFFVLCFRENKEKNEKMKRKGRVNISGESCRKTCGLLISLLIRLMIHTTKLLRSSNKKYSL